MHVAALLALTLAAQPPWGTGQSRPEDLDVWLITFSPGDTVTEWWGHTALVVQDRGQQQSRLYNYGMFGFGPGFVGRFIKGRLEFWVADDSTAGTFEMYRRLNRDVRIQELNLLPEQAAQLGRALADNVLPENRTYLYHHYDDNCSTRPRDMIDAVIGGQLLKATAAPARMSLRDHTRRYDQVSPPMSLVLDFLQNDLLDRPITQKEEAFLPDELELQLDALQLTRPDGSVVPAVKKKSVWFKATRAPVPAQTPNWTPWLLLLGCGLGGAALGLARWGLGGKRLPRVLLGLLHALLGLCWGTLGTVGLVLGTFTDNLVTHWNESLLLANPVTLAALPLGVMLMFGSRRGRTGLRWVWTLLLGTSVLAVLLKVLPMFDQANWNVIAWLLPMNAGLAAACWLDWRATRAAAPVQTNAPAT